MPSHDGNQLKSVGEYWRCGQPLDAGRLILVNLPTDTRPKWASRILRLVLAKSGVQCPAIEQLLHIADHETEWANAHRQFSILRRSTLDLERLQYRNREEECLLRHFYLAENVAKVIYNSTNPSDEFDEDAGWWVAACLRGFVDWWGDEEFSQAAWSALCFGEQHDGRGARTEPE